MRNILVMSATKKQYKYNMFRGWALKPAEERRNGMPTLIATKQSNGTERYYFNDADYEMHCMECGWNYTAKNTYRRLGEKDIQCPNCGYLHKAENTRITCVTGTEEKVPINWELKIQQLSKTKLALKFTYSYQYNPYEKSCPTDMEVFIFDLKANESYWENWHLKGWDSERMCLGNVLVETIKLGYFDDKEKMQNKSVFAGLLPHFEDDEKNKLENAIKVLKESILSIKTDVMQCFKQDLALSGHNPKNMLLDNLLNLAHKTRFWEAPKLGFLGTNKNDTFSWFKGFLLNYASNIKLEKDIETDIRDNGLSYYESVLKHFNIPDTPELKKKFTFRNIGLYKELERRYQNNNVVNLLFSVLSSVSGKLISSTSFYGSENKDSNINLILSVFEKRMPEIMELPDFLKKKIVEEIKYQVTNIAKLDPCYKPLVRSNRNYYGSEVNKYIIKFAEKAVDKVIFEESIRLEAEAERKNFFQKLSEKLDVPNTPMFRKYYRFEYVEQIKEVFNKYNTNTANEFLRVFNEASEAYYGHKEIKNYTEHANGRYRILKSVYGYGYSEFLNTIIQFYDTFKEPYPDIITPLYAARFVLKESNYANDTINMYNQLNEKSKQLFSENKPRMKELHNELTRLINLEKYPDKEFGIPQDVINRFEMYCENSKLKVLKKYRELLEIGNLMNNCTASYRDRLNENHVLVVYTNDLGKPLAELEIKDGAIVQAKLINNRSVSENQEINAEIINFAQKTGLLIKTYDINQEAKGTNEAAKKQAA